MHSPLEIPSSPIIPGAARATHRTARVVLVSFLFTFAASRMLVYLIMSRRLPDLFVRVGGTHIHHLNFGILLLAGVGAHLLFRRTAAPAPPIIVLLYGAGLALTFDEFGMWLHLNDEYWQRASFDAVIVIAALLALLAVAPRWRSLRPYHWVTAAMLLAALALFALLFRESLQYAHTRLAPLLHQLEEAGPH